MEMLNMDWSKQSEEIVKNWTEAQKALWENWSNMMQSSTAPTKFIEIWKQTVSTWEDNMEKTLETQAEWTESWFDSLNKEGLPEQMKQWVDQGETMSKQWLETQEKLWQGWFDFIKQSDTATLNEQFQAQGQKAYENWQAATEKIVNTQVELVNMWMPAAQGSPGNGETKTKKTTSKK
jgi:hypothetical protein